MNLPVIASGGAGNAETLAWAQLQDKYPTRLEVPHDEWEQLVKEIQERENMKAEGEEVKRLGGLHIIGTERHEARNDTHWSVDDAPAEAERLASCMQLSWVRLRSGRPSKIPTPEEAMGYQYSEQELVAARAILAMRNAFAAQPQPLALL